MLAGFKCYVLSDSMCKFINDTRTVKFQCRGGATTYSCINLIESGFFTVSGCDLIIIHVGTNDIHKFSVEESTKWMKVVIKLIRRRNKGVKVVISAVLPRPVDYHLTIPGSGLTVEQKVGQLNRCFRALQTEIPLVGFTPSYKSFSHRGVVLTKLFKEKGWDKGLHLSPKGRTVIRNNFGQVAADYRKSIMLGVQ